MSRYRRPFLLLRFPPTPFRARRGLTPSFGSAAAARRASPRTQTRPQTTSRPIGRFGTLAARRPRGRPASSSSSSPPPKPSIAAKASASSSSSSSSSPPKSRRRPAPPPASQSLSSSASRLHRSLGAFSAREPRRCGVVAAATAPRTSSWRAPSRPPQTPRRRRRRRWRRRRARTTLGAARRGDARPPAASGERVAPWRRRAPSRGDPPWAREAAQLLRPLGHLREDEQHGASTAQAASATPAERADCFRVRRSRACRGTIPTRRAHAGSPDVVRARRRRDERRGELRGDFGGSGGSAARAPTRGGSGRRGAGRASKGRTPPPPPPRPPPPPPLPPSPPSPP